MKTKHLLTTGLLALLAALTPARAVTILHAFTGGASDGQYPNGSLTLSGSTLYGMTGNGGGSSNGTLFSMNTDGSGFGVLHSFAGGVSDGANPYGTLTLSGSKFYGMTYSGGSSSGSGNGTIFTMNLDGTGFSLLHAFARSASDGGCPFGSLTLSGSTLYGVTKYGGSSNFGTIFRMNVDGTGFGLLHSFTGLANDAADALGSLTLSGSRLYGTTHSGGASSQGTVFGVNTDGTGFGLLHSFAGGASDGQNPYASLTLAGSKLYGTTWAGGSGGGNGIGTLFSMNMDGTGFNLLHSFIGGLHDGDFPLGSLTLSGSKLYGMTYLGGSFDKGTLFSIGTDGSGYALLESFGSTPADGASPYNNDVILSADASKLYGMTPVGGSANVGVVFSRAIATPEPASAALLGLGAPLLAARRRRG